MANSTRVLALVFLAAIGAACSSATPQTKEPAAAQAKARRELPDVQIAPLDGGGERSVREVVKGKVAVIDLWATWCTACREVTKNVELLHRSKEGTDLLVIGVDVGEERAKVEGFLEGRKPAYPIYLDPRLTLPDGLGQDELPAIIVVDREGAVRLVKNRIDAAVIGLVDNLLTQGAPAPLMSGGAAAP
jgi:thiol-disulfide isomerase/thioredoxin